MEMYYNSGMEQFEKFIDENLPEVDGFHPHFNSAVRHILTAGGKRFRPQLLLSVVKSYEPLLVESSYYPAFAIESLHTYSLIHDDLPSMDDADLRRGVETLHKLYDEVTAILVGDGLNSYAFEILSKSPFRDDIKVKLIRSLSENGGLNGMIIGQAIDCYFENSPLSRDKIEFLHINKTGKLIASALQMGAIIVGKERLAEELYSFGIQLGLLFQIQDDILDATQSEEEAGKPIGNDGDKNSFVTILGLDESIREADNIADELDSQLSSFDESLQVELRKVLEKFLYRHR
jgi:farnesyl diphosphate synthase